MYANLKVETSSGKELNAYKVEVGDDGTRVYLDGNDEGLSSYYQEAGMLKFRPGAKLTIMANF